PRTATDVFARAIFCASCSGASFSTLHGRGAGGRRRICGRGQPHRRGRQQAALGSSKDWKPEEIKENAVRAAQEYLATLDDAAFGAASPVTPKFGICTRTLETSLALSPRRPNTRPPVGVERKSRCYSPT